MRVDRLGSYQTVFNVIVGWDEHDSPLYNTHIEINCKEYNYDSTFNIQLLNQSGWDPVLDNIKFSIVPGPASMLLFGQGGCLLDKDGDSRTKAGLL